MGGVVHSTSRKAIWRIRAEIGPSAVRHYRKALLNPKLIATWIQLGHGYRETGGLDAAQDAYERRVDSSHRMMRPNFSWASRWWEG